MAHNDMPMAASTLRIFLAAGRRFSAAQGTWLLLGSALLTLLALRSIAAAPLRQMDAFFGRPGDSLLLLVVLSVLGYCLWLRHPQPRPQPPTPQPGSEPLADLLATHVLIEQEIDKNLLEVAGDTEAAALAIIAQVRRLHDTAGRLMDYLGTTSSQTSNLGQEMEASVAYLVDIGTFIEKLPGKIERDMHSVQALVKEIKAMDTLVDAVQAISLQSHLLAINAAIQASHAGSAGAAVRVLAMEMRKLAADSSAVASRINQGLGRARHVAEHGIALSIKESTQQLGEVSQAAATILKVKDNVADMSQYFKTRIAQVTQHNADLAADIAEVLGQIQFQDVVRQRIDRIRLVSGQRNTLLLDAAATADQPGGDYALLVRQFAQVLNGYLVDEHKHSRSAGGVAEKCAAPSIELF